ncbi:MAG: DNA polymerase III subunit delta [Bacteroides sp.]|nr:DNA polymerase III subunit delta [Bacteroides sp.]
MAAQKPDATSSQTYPQLVKEIRAKRLKPVYLLHGEEGYYIDELVNLFENLLPEEERDFNLYTLYGPETGVETVMDVCQRLPMMAAHQIVILKEAQAVRADSLNKLHHYAERPNPSTVLVIACRGEKAKGKELTDAVKKNGVIFESKRVTERNILPVISDLIKDKRMSVDPKALSMLRDYIGTDLSRLYNEIDKLAFILGPNAMITPEAIERNIGISKDYNNFELLDALNNRNAAKAMTIVEYFRNNPKNNPTIVTVTMLFNHYANLLIYHYTRDKSPSGYLDALGLRANETWRLRNYEIGARNYNVRQTLEIISAIRECDCRSKGIGSRQDAYDLLKDLIFRILTSSGIIRM